MLSNQELTKMEADVNALQSAQTADARERSNRTQALAVKRRIVSMQRTDLPAAKRRIAAIEKESAALEELRQAVTKLPNHRLQGPFLALIETNKRDITKRLRNAQSDLAFTERDLREQIAGLAQFEK
jgi:ribonuclease D